MPANLAEFVMVSVNSSRKLLILYRTVSLDLVFPSSFRFIVFNDLVICGEHLVHYRAHKSLRLVLVLLEISPIFGSKNGVIAINTAHVSGGHALKTSTNIPQLHLTKLTPR